MIFVSFIIYIIFIFIYHFHYTKNYYQFGSSLLYRLEVMICCIIFSMIYYYFLIIFTIKIILLIIENKSFLSSNRMTIIFNRNIFFYAKIISDIKKIKSSKYSKIYSDLTRLLTKLF